MFVIPALGMVRQENCHEFENALELQHSESQVSLRYYMRPVFGGGQEEERAEDII